MVEKKLKSSGVSRVVQVRELADTEYDSRSFFDISWPSLPCSGILSMGKLLCELESIAEMSQVFLGGFPQQTFSEHTIMCWFWAQESHLYN